MQPSIERLFWRLLHYALIRFFHVFGKSSLYYFHFGQEFLVQILFFLDSLFENLLAWVLKKMYRFLIHLQSFQ